MMEAVTKFEPDAEDRNCFDCTHNRAAVSWWCVNEEAREYRGTSIPGVYDCPFWEPCRQWDKLSLFEKWFGRHIVIYPQPRPSTDVRKGD